MLEHDALHSAQTETLESVMELPLLLSRQQMNLLASAAQRRGMTSAQFLRKLIASACETEAKTA